MKEKFHIEQIVNKNYKSCLLRVDFNVPISDTNIILDNTRIHAVKKTIDLLINNKIKVILISHLGRPSGKKNLTFSLNKLVMEIENVLNYKVNFLELDDQQIKNKIDAINTNEIILLENIRFFRDEESYSDIFSKKLSSLADFYINEAFAVSHRRHSSITGVPLYLPSYMGYKMYDEYTSVLNSNQQFKNSTAIFGGAKIDDKILILQNFIKKVETILIGGGMIKSFINSKDDNYNTAKLILNNGVTKIILPEDILIKSNNTIKTKLIQDFSNDDQIVDIGPKSINKYTNIINDSNYILWNGPMGIFEEKETSIGTRQIVNSIQDNEAAYTVAGGGSTVQSINQFGNFSNFNHVSTGGGAFMEFIENGSLPGIDAIIENKIN